jgi:hypothetical protein
MGSDRPSCHEARRVSQSAQDRAVHQVLWIKEPEGRKSPSPGPVPLRVMEAVIDVDSTKRSVGKLTKRSVQVPGLGPRWPTALGHRKDQFVGLPAAPIQRGGGHGALQSQKRLVTGCMAHSRLEPRRREVEKALQRRMLLDATRQSRRDGESKDQGDINRRPTRHGCSQRLAALRVLAPLMAAVRQGPRLPAEAASTAGRSEDGRPD